jgi:uncharacterized protein involved in exopolysaccharide biosynthesis
MESQLSALIRREPPALTRRDVVRPIFRYRRLALRLFMAMALILVGIAVFWPARYRAEMKILVKRERVDPVLSPDRDYGSPVSRDISDVEVYSEVELLKSRDLLERVVIEAGLAGGPDRTTSNPVAAARALRTLQSRLRVVPARKTTVIDVTYESRDPQQAARVLSILLQRYLEKHLALRGSAGSRDFFAAQAGRLRDELRAAEQRLIEFGQQHDLVSAATEKETALQQLAAFQATQAQLRAQIADLDRRRQALDEEAEKTPARQITALRTQDNGELVRELKTRVLELEIRRTEMLPKFAPTYPPFRELEAKLGQARAALSAAETTPLREETTDRNPTHQWIQGEIARAEAERQALQARVTATMATVAEYRARARRLDEEGAKQQELIRAVKSTEDNYVLYQKKEEEARISDALDRARIANVAVAQAPTVPALPTNASRGLLLVLGLVLSLVASVAMTYLVDSLNPRFRTREEVEVVLQVPVLAALPESVPR